MNARLAAAIFGCFVLLSLLAAFPPKASAAVVDCSPDDATDPSGDVEESPASAPAVTGFGQIDLLGVCVTESADNTYVIVTNQEAANTVLGTRRWVWTFSFRINGTQDMTYTFTHTNDVGTAEPPGTSESQGARVQFVLPKSQFPLLTLVSNIAVDTNGVFIPATGNQVTGSDRVPDTNVLNQTYFVGQRAPPTADTDGDGVPDKDEIEDGSNPTLRDSDGDGLDDGEDSAPTNPDADDDGYLDGLDPDPANPDFDGDGLEDGDERFGTTARSAGISGDGFFNDAAGSTDPRNPDTDNDTLSDSAEVNGNPPTDPNKADTDGDGISDAVEREQGSDPVDAGGGGGDDGGGDDGGSKQGEDIVTYLPISVVSLIIIILVSVGGIFWRWG